MKTRSYERRKEDLFVHPHSIQRQLVVGEDEERQDMVMQILELGGLHYDVEQKEIAAITPRPEFLPVLRLLEDAYEYEEATGTLSTPADFASSCILR